MPEHLQISSISFRLIFSITSKLYLYTSPPAHWQQWCCYSMISVQSPSISYSKTTDGYEKFTDQVTLSTGHSITDRYLVRRLCSLLTAMNHNKATRRQNNSHWNQLLSKLSTMEGDQKCAWHFTTNFISAQRRSTSCSLFRGLAAASLTVNGGLTHNMCRSRYLLEIIHSPLKLQENLRGKVTMKV